MGIAELLLFLMLLAKKGASGLMPGGPSSPTPAAVRPPVAVPAAKPTAPVVPWPVASYATTPSGQVVPVPTFQAAPLPAFPSEWEADTPPPKAVIARASALLKPMWAGGKAGPNVQEQTNGRWITYKAVKHGAKKAVVAYRIKGQRAKAA